MEDNYTKDKIIEMINIMDNTVYLNYIYTLLKTLLNDGG